MDIDVTVMDSGAESDCSDLWDEQPERFEQNVHHTEADVSWTPNILDILNDDCWRHILDYVPIRDILCWNCWKPVSRQWQAMVHRYIEDVRLRIETIGNVWDVDEQIRRRKYRVRVLILKDDSVSLVAALNRWGACVRELVYDVRSISEAVLMDLGKKCPNLEDITFVRLRWYRSWDWVKNFTRLKRVCFENSSITDNYVQEFLKNNPIEELVIRMTDSFSGVLFEANEANDNGVLTSLKTLVISNCIFFNFSNLLLAVVPVNRLAGVTKLELRCYVDLPSQMSVLLDKIPQLEHLTLDCDGLYHKEMAAAIPRLDRLEHLGWYKGAVFRGKELEAVRKDMQSWRSYPISSLTSPRLLVAGPLSAHNTLPEWISNITSL